VTLSPTAIAERERDREALVFGAQRWTYGQLDHFSAQLAALLWHRGLKQGDVVALLISNRAEFLAAAWAAQRSGLYYLPVPTKLTASEIRYILQDSDARALIISPDLSKVGREAAQDLDLHCFGLDDGGEFEPLLESFGNYEAPPAVEGGDMLYTSGTTGRPKGVRRPLSGEALGSDRKRVERGERLFGFGPDTVFLSPAPLYHAAPLRFAMNLLRTGAKIVGMSKFDPAEALRLIQSEAVTHSQWVPTMFTRLLALPDEERREFDTRSHRCAIHAGAPCPPSVKREMIGWWGPILSEYYSGTESVGFTHITSEEWLEHPGSVGRAYGCTIHILDEQGCDLPSGTTGDVYFEGKSGLEYHNDPEKTRAAVTARGWATMGDIGHIDRDGFLYLTDRKNFTIISGGVNVYPSEVEAALMEHKAVRDCAVFGLPDPDLGEIVAAIVETDFATGAHDIALANRIMEDLRATLAGPKRPRLWRFDSIGRTETGKVQKQKLREASQSAGYMIDLRNQNAKVEKTTLTP
jgi:long-chain acyl-CoA synthetase